MKINLYFYTGFTFDLNFMNHAGIITHPSPYAVKESIDRLQALLEKNGVTIYARIDQQAELAETGQIIPPLEFILFGNPKAGGPIMIENRLAALDLPLKLIAWEDDQQKVWVAYNDASYIGQRYSLSSVLIAPLDINNLISKTLRP